MKKMVLLLLPFMLMIIAIFIKQSQKIEKKEGKSVKIEKIEKSRNGKIDYNSVEYFENYVIDVIENGSNILNLPSGPMDGGFVSKDDAKKIATYMAALQGFKPTHPEWVKDGAALFHGNCTGCHGVGGKGQKGYFPDLTRKPLLGIEKKIKEPK